MAAAFSMATHSNILAWEIPWTEDPGGLHSMGSQRIRYDSATEHTHTHTHRVMQSDVSHLIV